MRGRVQGVSHRWSMAEEARRSGVRVSVRNRRDGSVETTAAGPSAAVDRLIEWARVGTRQALVTRVEVFSVTAHDSFEQRPTE